MARHAGAYRSEKFRKEQKRKKKLQEKMSRRQHGSSAGETAAAPEEGTAGIEAPASVTEEKA